MDRNTAFMMARWMLATIAEINEVVQSGNNSALIEHADKLRALAEEFQVKVYKEGVR